MKNILIIISIITTFLIFLNMNNPSYSMDILHPANPASPTNPLHPMWDDEKIILYNNINPTNVNFKFDFSKNNMIGSDMIITSLIDNFGKDSVKKYIKFKSEHLFVISSPLDYQLCKPIVVDLVAKGFDISYLGRFI